MSWVQIPPAAPESTVKALATVAYAIRAACRRKNLIVSPKVRDRCTIVAACGGISWLTARLSTGTSIQSEALDFTIRKLAEFRIGTTVNELLDAHVALHASQEPQEHTGCFLGSGFACQALQRSPRVFDHRRVPGSDKRETGRRCYGFKKFVRLNRAAQWDARGDSGNRLRSIAVRNKKPPACAGGSCSYSRVQLTG